MSLGAAKEPQDVARYIESLAGELKGLATAAGLGFLAHLLAMVVEDAGATAKRLEQEGAPKN